MAWKLTADEKYIERINLLTKSWCESNPYNQGANWVCAQEVSIRLIHAIQAWNIINPLNLENNNISDDQEEFIAMHLERIHSQPFMQKDNKTIIGHLNLQPYLLVVIFFF